ncbi:MAG: hypothetical protein AAFX93_19905 [Verrucomicrobiota bacterium]
MNIRITNLHPIVVEHTPTCSTSATSAGDILADTEPVSGVWPYSISNPVNGVISSLALLDKNDHGANLDVVLLKSPASMGAENAAVSIDDVSAEQIIGVIPVRSADYTDFVNSQVATPQFNPIPLKIDAGERLNVAIIDRSGTNTFTASGLKLHFGIVQA